MNTHTVETEGIGSSLLVYLTSKLDSSEREQEQKIWREDLVSAIYHSDAAIDEKSEGPFISETRRKPLQTAFIDQLRYPRMDDRHGRIAKAYEKTFQWVFQDEADGPRCRQSNGSNFRRWLESNSQIYWITGKAGSGKSTLIKFICQDENPSQVQRCLDDSEGIIQQGEEEVLVPTGWEMKELRSAKYLRKWSGSSKLVVATFFFWNSGTSLQRSQRGLLLSLLCQVLQQWPEIIPTISPNRWEALCLFDNDFREWTDEELSQTLRETLTIRLEAVKFCLFIDGLDEFDGDHIQLIQLLRDFLVNKNVKLCVSSRPWVVFEDAFKHKPSLKLEDLTYEDIRLYVTLTLNRDLGFEQLTKREPEFASELVENIVSKANGVFLWVHLVVASLLAGMGYGDRISDLQRRLDYLPPDLEMLYDKMLSSLDPFYLEHAAQLFTLVQQSPDPLSILLLSFADEDDCPGFALKQPIQNMTKDEIFIRSDTMRRRVNSRCKGLLEVGPNLGGSRRIGEGTVQYLHKTVKDFIESDTVQQTLRSAMVNPFDPHLRLGAAALAYLKTSMTASLFLHYGLFWPTVERCLYSVSRTNSASADATVALLDEMDKTCQSLVRRLIENKEPRDWMPVSYPETSYSQALESGQWVLSHRLLSNDQMQSYFGSTFLSLAVRYGAVHFVRAKANPGCLALQPSVVNRSRIWPLLMDATYYDPSWKRDTVPDISMINCLLEMGADPNFRLNLPSRERTGADGGRLLLPTPASPWGQVVQTIKADFRDDNIKEPWKSIAATMIAHGAELKKETFHILLGEGDSRSVHADPWNSRLFLELLKLKRASTSKSWMKLWTT